MKQLSITILVAILVASLSPLTSFAEESVDSPSVRSGAAILLDANTGTILYEKNSDEQMYPASLTKMATAIYAIEKGNLEDIVTVSKKAREVGGTRVYLEEGEKVTLKKLVQGLLINSGNDAGVAIAEHLEGSVEAFSTKINQYLKDEIGVENTNFENPHGLFGENHYTTAQDLALITQYALKNKVFTNIFGTEELEWNGTGWDTTIYNHHRLIKGEIPFEGIIGGKNGYVQQSRFTLATAAERGNLKLVVVVLKAESDDIAYEDTVALLDHGFEDFQVSEIPTLQTFTDKNNTEYAVEQPIKYTHEKNETVQMDVNSKGVLKILGEDGRLLATHQLEKNIVMNTMNTTTKPDKSNDQGKASNILKQVLFLLPFIIVLALFILIKRKRRNAMRGFIK